PVPPPESPNANSDQVPFGSVPFSTASAEPWGCGAAAGGPLNPNPSPALDDGRNVPEVIGSPSVSADPASSKVSERPSAPSGPPTPSISRTDWPPGATSSRST